MPMRRFKSLRYFHSPAQFLWLTVGVIFIAEVAVMYLLPLVVSETASQNVEAICDATLLAILVSPIIWVLTIRPLSRLALEQREWHDVTMELARDAILTVDMGGNIVASNKAAEAMTLEDPTGAVSLQNAAISQYLFGQRHDIMQRLKDAASDGHLCLKEHVITNIGRRIAVEVSVSRIPIAGQTHLLLIVRDSSAREQVERQVEEANQMLIDAAHLAGKAEIATSVLHNVGNVLTSISVLSTTLQERVSSNHVPSLRKVVGLLDSQQSRLGDFFDNDPRGKQLPAYLRSLSATLETEQQGLISELQALDVNVDHAKRIVAAQQNLARGYCFEEEINLRDILDNATTVVRASFERHHVQLNLDADETPVVVTDRHKLIQILVNLFTNAKDAVLHLPAAERQISVRVSCLNSESLRIDVTDGGIGISRDHLTRIFSQGFTTKSSGHGFGLHYCGLAASSLGGSLTVFSDGPGKGATFSLQIPLLRTAPETCA
ncbi:MAG: PAS domain S-box protein [Planctomycetaceae bacterium]|nr:PAS domain S-box protein [Planctomycetaceae bacterium]